MRLSSTIHRTVLMAALLPAVVGGLAGCGKTISRAATEQLLTSDAVDRSVAQIDFRALSGKKVYFDTTYIQHVKGAGFVNAEYIISSLRQQILAANCLLLDKKDDADYIIEARVGALGTDATEITYGIPANTMLNSAAELVPTAPAMPAIPELALAKKNDQLAAAKIGVFAYDRETREPVWQAGISRAMSDSKDVWFFGAGPFQSGTIHAGKGLVGSAVPLMANRDEWREEQSVSYAEEHLFKKKAKGAQSQPRPATVTYQPQQTAAAAAPKAETPKADAGNAKPAEPKETAKVAENQAAKPASEKPADTAAAAQPPSASNVEHAVAERPEASDGSAPRVPELLPSGYVRVTDVESVLQGELRLQSVVQDDVPHEDRDAEEAGD